jgi:type I restriction enzyme, S subunit
MTDLPIGWAEARLADVAEVRLGRQRSPSRATGERMRPYLRAANVNWSGLALTDVKEMAFTEAESKVYELEPGDILLGEASGSPAEVGKPGQYKGEIPGCCFQNTLLRVRFPKELLSDFYELFFRKEALTGRFAAGSRGVGIHHLGAAALTNWAIPVPPRAQQERIVTAIEEAFSKLDAGEAALRATRQRLKRLSESVLAAAVTGRLVPQDPTDEPASKLLSRFDAKFVHQIVGGPAGWVTSEMGELASIVSGNTPKGLADNVAASGDVPLIKVGDLAAADVYLTGSRTWVTREVQERLRLRTCPVGTIVFPKRGGAIATNRKRILGREAAFDLNTMGLIPKGDLGDWLWVWFAQLDLRKISDGSNVPQINHTDVRPLAVPVPPGAEQNRIVAEVERQFSFIDACERTVDVGLVRSAALRRSILKSAFEGRLVPQDSTDEPASVLLGRIPADRDAVGKVPKPHNTLKPHRTAPTAGPLTDRG